MSNPALTVEALFGDLNLDLGLEAPAAPLQPSAAPAAPEQSALFQGFADEAEAALDAVGFTSAGGLLCDADLTARPTCPYDIPADEFAHSVGLWGDDERFSALSTTPLALDELPPDAYPTQLNVVGSD